MPAVGLADNWRIQIKNEISGTIDASKITIKFRGEYLDSNGKLIYDAESSDIASQSGTISDNAVHDGAAQDNGAETNPFLGGRLYIDCDLSTNTATPSGDVKFILQEATADTPAWPDDETGVPILTLNFTAKVRKQRVVRL